MPLSAVLGVQNVRALLLQHLLIGARHSYRVMNPEKAHLWNISENVQQEWAARWAAFRQPGSPGQPRVQVNWGAPPQVSYWAVEDAAGNVRGGLVLQTHGMHAVADLTNAEGATLVQVNVKRGLASMTADAVDPAGQKLLEARGNLFHLNFALHDATGSEVAKIHESAISARDTYRVDLVGNVDPVNAVVFGVLIDHLKGK